MLIVGPIIDDLFPLLILGPEFLGTAVLIALNDIISRLENGLGRPVILFQQDHLGLGIVLFKVQDVLHISTPPAIDGLVGIPDYADILETRSQEFDQLILGMVGVLVLIDMDVLVALLVIG